MHVTGADGTQKDAVRFSAMREDHEDSATAGQYLCCSEPLFRGVGVRNAQCHREQGGLDLRLVYAMLPAFGSISRVPVDTRDFHTDEFRDIREHHTRSATYTTYARMRGISQPQSRTTKFPPGEGLEAATAALLIAGCMGGSRTLSALASKGRVPARRAATQDGD